MPKVDSATAFSSAKDERGCQLYDRHHQRYTPHSTSCKSVDGKTPGHDFEILKLYRSCKETAFSKMLMKERQDQKTGKKTKQLLDNLMEKRWYWHLKRKHYVD